MVWRKLVSNRFRSVTYLGVGGHFLVMATNAITKGAKSRFSIFYFPYGQN